MKKLLAVLFWLSLSAVVFAGIGGTAQAQANVGFAWDYSTPMPSGFELTITPTSGAAIITDCGASVNKTCTASAVPSGSYSTFVRAYNVGVPATLKSYSAASNTITFTVPVAPATPSNDRVTTATMVLNMTWPAGTQLAMDITVPPNTPVGP